MRNEADRVNTREIEALLRGDRQAEAPADTRIAMAELAPVIAREAARLRRRKRNRRESIVMLLAAVPVTILLVLGAAAYCYGNIHFVRNMAISAGILSAMALLTLPLMEKFLPEKG